MAKQKTPKTPPNPDPDETEDEDGDGEDESKDLDNRINSIVTNRLKRWGESFSKTIEGTITKALASKPVEIEDEDGEVEETTKAKGKVPKPDPKLSKLERELTETRNALKAEQDAKKDAEEKGKRNEERTILDSVLAEAGITDKALRSGAQAMIMGDGKIVRDEDGKVKWKGQDKYGQDVLLDPTIAAKAWVKTDGKSYQPAVDAGGSGAGRSSNSMPKGEWNKLSDREKAKEEIRRATLGLPPVE